MKEIGYGDILRSAWRLEWRNKSYLVLGILLGLGFVGSQNPETRESSENLALQIKPVADFILANWIELLIVSVWVLALVLLFAILHHVARSGLLRSVLDGRTGTGLPACWNRGLKYFARTLAISLLFGVFISALALALAAPVILLFLRESSAAGAWLSLVAIAIFTVLAVGASYTARFAILYVVSSDLRIGPAIEHGHALFRKNISESLLMSLTLAVPSIAYILAASFFLSVIYAVFGPDYPEISIISDFSIVAASAWLAWSAALGIVRAALLSPLSVFSEICWTLFFQKLAGKHDWEDKLAHNTAPLRQNEKEAMSPVKTEDVAQGVDNSRLS